VKITDFGLTREKDVKDTTATLSRLKTTMMTGCGMLSHE
jgi:hypothetical protein